MSHRLGLQQVPALCTLAASTPKGAMSDRIVIKTASPIRRMAHLGWEWLAGV